MPSTKRAKVDFLIVGQSVETFKNDIALLQKAGYRNVQFADDGILANNTLTSSHVGFVISELEMPNMNGIEFLKLIRRHPFFMATPFLLVSKDKQMDMIKYALDELADGYLLTPYSGEEFLCAIIRIQQKISSLSNLQVMIRKARIQFLKREYDKSIAIVNEILSHEPENIEALLILSECLYRQRNVEAARKHLKFILKKFSHNCKALHLLSKLCQFESDCGDAFTYLTSAQRQTPLNKDLQIDLGKFYLETGMDEKADEVFNDILSSSPTDFNLIKIGKALLKKNRLEDASKFLDKTVRPLPGTAYIFKMYADLLEKEGNSDAQIEQLQKCVSLSPGNPDYSISLANVLKSVGRSPEAQNILKNYLTIDPENETVKSMAASF
nr:response regulator [Desulfobulbaceae bacterium]